MVGPRPRVVMVGPRPRVVMVGPRPRVLLTPPLILSVAEKCLYGEFMSPTKTKLLGLSCQVLNTTVRLQQNLEFLGRFPQKSPSYQPACKSFQWRRADTCGQTDMTKITGEFRDNANAPKTD
jgi:hypothetical protein